jgi:hypothetical protein
MGHSPIKSDGANGGYEYSGHAKYDGRGAFLCAAQQHSQKTNIEHGQYQHRPYRIGDPAGLDTVDKHKINGEKTSNADQQGGPNI